MLVVVLCALYYRRVKSANPPSPAVQPSPFSSIAMSSPDAAYKATIPRFNNHRPSTLQTSASALDLQLADLSSSPVNVHLTSSDTINPETADYHVTAFPAYRGTHVAVGATVGATMIPASHRGTHVLVGATVGSTIVPSADRFRTSVTMGTGDGSIALWKKYKDGNGRSFWYNTVTGVSEWTLPADAVAQMQPDSV